MKFNPLSNPIRLAALLVLPLALSTTGCSGGRMALSLGLHAQTVSSADQETPQTTHHYPTLPQFDSRTHRHTGRASIVETSHHMQRNQTRSNSLTMMKEGVSNDAFYPVTGESTNN